MTYKYPDRWLDYTKYGSQVQGTQFIALKVPLGKKYFTKRMEESFTPDDAVQEIPGLGMVIDLTFTSKYYNPSEFLHHNVQHKKILTKGHEVPKRSLVNQFIRTVNDFLGDEQNKDKLIGVHCTHGLNRTGYFVCAYMILIQGQAPKSAIHSFNEARAHSMERANYLNSLIGLIPLSYKAHDDQDDTHETRDSRSGYRDQRSRYDRRADNHRRDRSRENHNGYYCGSANAYRERFNNWRDGPTRDDRPNNWRDNFAHDDRRPYRNYREYNRPSSNGWRDHDSYDDHRSTRRNNDEEACNSSYPLSNGDRKYNRFRWVRKDNGE
ncbi:RNA/RNP complex-1-interacting phosphatase [Ochlerotatus camptorhynchus]|uniref:RNA/RNP complex-1-interacting phosphatase n=1 Tax=Ochlerotatus camptorhynchus TaxID=644619 RepID=UPI0031DF95F0